jgi:hypothetical protein
MAQQYRLFQPDQPTAHLAAAARALHTAQGTLAILALNPPSDLKVKERAQRIKQTSLQVAGLADQLRPHIPDLRGRIIVGAPPDQYEVIRDHDRVSARPYQRDTERECPSCGRHGGWESDCADEWHDHQASAGVGAA